MYRLYENFQGHPKYIFAEDRTICELEQAAFDEQGSDWNHEIFPAIRDLRRVLVENGIPQAEQLAAAR
jgi:hypothetical protein